MSDRQGTTTTNQQNQIKLSFKLNPLPMKLETMSSTVLLRNYHMILSTQQNQILLMLLYFRIRRREEIAETAEVPAPAPAPTLETVKEQSHTPGSRKSMRKNLGRPASSYSDFYM